MRELASKTFNVIITVCCFVSWVASMNKLRLLVIILIGVIGVKLGIGNVELENEPITSGFNYRGYDSNEKATLAILTVQVDSSVKNADQFMDVAESYCKYHISAERRKTSACMTYFVINDLKAYLGMANYHTDPHTLAKVTTTPSKRVNKIIYACSVRNDPHNCTSDFKGSFN